MSLLYNTQYVWFAIEDISDRIEFQKNLDFDAVVTISLEKISKIAQPQTYCDYDVTTYIFRPVRSKMVSCFYYCVCNSLNSFPCVDGK